MVNMSDKTDLFGVKETQKQKSDFDSLPLAIRMRPQSLCEFVGQKHILSKGKLLRRLIDSDRISSLILYGVPGTGKSALAYIISHLTNSQFVSITATFSSVNELKKIIQTARKRKSMLAQRTILFIDEIHRFNKAQQDVLIHDVEFGNIVLIGATTHNPFFYIIPALISRSHIFEFKPHSEQDLLFIIKRAISEKERGLGKIPINADLGALKFLCRASDGDARRALNALEVGVLTTPADDNGKLNFTKEVAEESIQKKIVRYDRDEDDHYDTISAFIKSMRGSDPDSAIYWLAKMLYAGEDPRFIARRIVICAAEDVGNADPHAVVLANAVYQAVEFVGMPEARILLAQAVTYVASAPKSNASYLAIEAATEDLKNETSEEVPEHLKDASYKSAKKLGRGEGYEYAHNFKDHYVKQIYTKKRKKFYQPTNMGYEKTIKAWLAYLKKE